MSPVKRVFRYLLCAFMTLAGANHFINPALYVALIPPFLPAPELLNYASGVAEIVLAWACWCRATGAGRRGASSPR